MPALQPEVISLNAQSYFEFEPTDVSKGLATYQGTQFAPDPNSTNGVIPVNLSPALTPVMTISNQKPSKTSRISKTRLKIVIPQPVLDNGVATAAKDHENSIDVTIMSSEKATTAERDQLVQAFLVAMNLPTVAAVAIDNKSIY